MSKTRIYAVQNEVTKSMHLVRAKSKTSAIGFVARNNYSVELASQEAIVDFMLADPSAKVEDATRGEEVEP